jgi:hypothetical protein
MTPSPPRQRLTQLNNHRRLTKKPETYSPKQSETRPRMDLAHGGQQFEHISMVRQHGPKLQKVYEASKEHATRSKGTQGAIKYRSRPQELPAIPPQLTSELLHCLSTLPDPWPLAKITINLDTASQWVSNMGRLFFDSRPADRSTTL